MKNKPIPIYNSNLSEIVGHIHLINGVVSELTDTYANNVNPKVNLYPTFLLSGGKLTLVNFYIEKEPGRKNES